MKQMILFSNFENFIQSIKIILISQLQIYTHKFFVS
jgi:hypothetical protein